jgi:hypothetical protein
MKKDEHDEILPEYDFSGGVRGRYAARIAESARAELLARSAAQDVQVWLTQALTQVQSVEAGVVAFLALVAEETPAEAGESAALMLEHSNEPLLAAFLTDLREHALLAPEFELRLMRVVQERNWLVHRSGLGARTALGEARTILPVLARLEALTDDATFVSRKLRELLEQSLERRGLSRQEIRRKADETIERWIAA